MPVDEAPKPQVHGRSFGAEFLLIVVSILAAFALQAWWSARVEREETHARLVTLRDEFEATRADLAREAGRLDSVRSAIAGLLGNLGPTVPLVSIDSLNASLDRSFRTSTIELRDGALQALLASGQLAAIEDPELTTLLAAWPSDVARLRTKSSMLEENREIVIGYLQDRISTLQIAEKTGQMTAYPTSRFKGDPAGVQRDMKVEGLVGNRGMLVEDTDEIIKTLDERAQTALRLIDQALTR